MKIEDDIAHGLCCKEWVFSKEHFMQIERCRALSFSWVNPLKKICGKQFYLLPLFFCQMLTLIENITSLLKGTLRTSDCCLQWKCQYLQNPIETCTSSLPHYRWGTLEGVHWLGRGTTTIVVFIERVRLKNMMSARLSWRKVSKAPFKKIIISAKITHLPVVSNSPRFRAAPALHLLGCWMILSFACGLALRRPQNHACNHRRPRFQFFHGMEWNR